MEAGLGKITLCNTSLRGHMSKWGPHRHGAVVPRRAPPAAMRGAGTQHSTSQGITGAQQNPDASFFLKFRVFFWSDAAGQGEEQQPTPVLVAIAAPGLRKRAAAGLHVRRHNFRPHSTASRSSPPHGARAPHARCCVHAPITAPPHSLIPRAGQLPTAPRHSPAWDTVASMVCPP